ncbi:histidine phosphatase superfamily branch 1 protein [Nitzschia inconspicua]|uniref:Histidine phosphatase superfamily branch 1 protein n=1 Tax=Nitzschia inconspicua TaxID=303405 RepID=A0A9K3PQB0_9STRA|nr:histidine phosphatase superfamily branch 1 protein [Nitzschia inconspicua]
MCISSVCSVFVLSFKVLSTVRGLTTTTITTTSPLSASSIWSESAIEFAKQQSLSERKKLLAEEGSPLKGQSIHIRGERVDSLSLKENDYDTDCVTTKIVHFQRHGQGYHNLVGEILREAGVKVSVDSTDPNINPWLRPDLVDSPLTETGRWQCAQLQQVAAGLNPELVIVSPLTRTLQTAKITFAKYYESDYAVPWVAHEACREELGVLTCNKRRPLSEIRTEFPKIEFFDMIEEDTLWNPHQRESSQSKGERIYRFLVDFLSKREESSIAVITHSAWLFHALNVVIDCGDDLELSSCFLTGEIRSIKLTFSSAKEI